MLTKQDLESIREVVRDEIEDQVRELYKDHLTLRVEFQKEISSLKTSVINLRSTIKNLQKDIKNIFDFIKFFDRSHQDSRKRLDRIEKHLKLPSI